MIIFKFSFFIVVYKRFIFILDYPWIGFLKENLLDENLLYFLDLADYRVEASRFYDYIIADFFLLMIVAAQVFRVIF